MNPARAMKYTAAGTLFFLAAVHANWARGSSWPAADERQLARAVIGEDEMPSAGACLVVAALLTVGGSLVAGQPAGRPRLQRTGAAGVAATLAARGIAGATGLIPVTSETFLWWDRRLYSPLCLLLAALSLAGAVPQR
ncbi:MAG: DUF3995 domain-containing protein [Rubrobacteraceae bacterium]